MKCIYDFMSVPVLKYPLAALFLADFHLTWRYTEKQIAGDLSFTFNPITTGIHAILRWIRELLWKK